MPARILFTLAALAALFATTAAARAGDCPHCQKGGCDNVTYRCKMVPDVKPIKKIVYECREVPYCNHQLPKFGHGCDCCPECQACPKFKKVLVKKEIICGEKHGMKCVPEAIPCCRCGQQPNAVQAPAKGASAVFAPPSPVVVAE